MLLDDLSKLFQAQRNAESGFLYLLFGCVYKLFTALRGSFDPALGIG